MRSAAVDMRYCGSLLLDVGDYIVLCGRRQGGRSRQCRGCVYCASEGVSGRGVFVPRLHRWGVVEEEMFCCDVDL